MSLVATPELIYTCLEGIVVVGFEKVDGAPGNF